MAYADILVHVDDTRTCAQRLKIADLLAEGHGARLIGLHVRPRPDLPAFVTAQYGAEVESAFTRFNAETASRAKAFFDALTTTDGRQREWRDVEGVTTAELCLHARYVDLTVVGQSDGESESGLADALVLDTGRPVLVVPHAGHFDTIGRRVLIAWNASREATRAVHDAMAILKRADLVHVMAINPHGGAAGHGDVPGADLCLHLSRHGVKAVCEHITSDDLGVGAMLLSRAADEDIDLIVMGAWGRSRLSERILGGATRHLLRHMTVPVLMSH